MEIKKIYNDIYRWLDRYVKVESVFDAVVCMLPFFILEMVTGNEVWGLTLIVSLAYTISYRNIKAGPHIVLLHMVLICALFYLFVQVNGHIWYFVIFCSTLGALLLGMTRIDKIFSGFGILTFVAVVYPGMGLNLDGRTPSAAALQTIPYFMIAVVPTLLICLYHHHRSWRPNEKSWSRHMSKTHHLSRELTDGYSGRLSIVAIAVAVGLASWFVEKHNVPDAQWFIWSSVAIFTGDKNVMHERMKYRMRGSLIGVPIGILLGIFIIPHNALYIPILELFIILSLSGVRSYPWATGFRCCLHSIALTIIGGSLLLEASRLLNVLGGTVVAFLVYYIVHMLYVWRKRWLIVPKNLR